MLVLRGGGRGLAFWLFIYLFIYLFIVYCLASSLITFADTDSFLFTLVNPAGNQPVKLTSKPGGGIRCCSGRGPAFGNKSYYDLKIWDGNQAGYLDLGYGFIFPSSENKTGYFTGSDGFVVTELEVYKVGFKSKLST